MNKKDEEQIKLLEEINQDLKNINTSIRKLQVITVCIDN